MMTAAAAVGNLPATIRIGAFDFSLEKWSDFKAEAVRRYGEMSAHELTIRIRETHSHPSRVIDTLIHEVNHAAFWVFGIEDEDKEERTVNLISTAWVSIYRDNPWLLDWIKASLSP
jgi:hypothetical protein